MERDGVPLIAAELVEVRPAANVTGSGLNRSYPGGGPGGNPEAGRLAKRLTLAPLERLAVPHALSGAHGQNRATAFCSGSRLFAWSPNARQTTAAAERSEGIQSVRIVVRQTRVCSKRETRHKFAIWTGKFGTEH